MEKRNSLLKVIIIALLLVGVVVVFALGSIKSFYPDDDFEKGDTGTPYIEVSPIEGKTSIVAGVVEEWLNGNGSATALYNEYSSYGRVYSSNSVILYYSIFNLADAKAIVSQKVELSENSAFNDAKIYEIRYDKRNVKFDYLKTDTTYYYRISAVLSDGNEIQASGKFETADTPRIISLNNPRNIRDIGGWDVAGGKKIKQGLFYRGSEIDGATQQKLAATQEDISVLRDELGIKTEIDLRGENISYNQNILGVEYKVYNFLAYKDCFTSEGQEALKNAIKDLAVAENYPVYVHCSSGTDMTGTLCFFVEALLGMNEKDIYTDWEFSALCNGSAPYDNMSLFIDSFKMLEGDTLQAKASNYLLSIGITQEEIDSIRRILLED